MKNLISMTDFVLEQWYPENLEKEEFEDVYTKIHNYAKFLKQPLELWMFVPCDEKGKVLKEPEWWHRYNCGASPFMNIDEIIPCQDYKKAKERCLFEGFEICDRQEEFSCLVFDNEHFSIRHILSGTIEELVKYNLQLTTTALKQIGL